jgi:hypothetical protein
MGLQMASGTGLVHKSAGVGFELTIRQGGIMSSLLLQKKAPSEQWKGLKLGAGVRFELTIPHRRDYEPDLILLSSLGYLARFWGALLGGPAVPIRYRPVEVMKDIRPL